MWISNYVIDAHTDVHDLFILTLMLYSIINSNSMKILSTCFMIILSIYFVLIILMVNLIRIKAQEFQGINYTIEEVRVITTQTNFYAKWVINMSY